MNKQNRVPLNILVQIVLCVALVFAAYGATFRSSNVFGLSEQTQKDIDSFKTALAGTSQALLGPFPTQTMPTKTITPTPTATPRISATPTFTP